MISDELFIIILNELAVQEGSVFAFKIKARLYNGEYRQINNEFGRKEDLRMMELKQKFALKKNEKKPTQNTLADIANRMLSVTKGDD